MWGKPPLPTPLPPRLSSIPHPSLSFPSPGHPNPLLPLFSQPPKILFSFYSSVPASLLRSRLTLSLRRRLLPSARNGWVKRVTSCRKRVSHRSVSTFLIFFFFCADACQKNRKRERYEGLCAVIGLWQPLPGSRRKMYREKCDRAATRLISLTALTLGNSCCARAQKKKSADTSACTLKVQCVKCLKEAGQIARLVFRAQSAGLP